MGKNIAAQISQKAMLDILKGNKEFNMIDKMQWNQSQTNT